MKSFALLLNHNVLPTDKILIKAFIMSHIHLRPGQFTLLHLAASEHIFSCGYIFAEFSKGPIHGYLGMFQKHKVYLPYIKMCIHIVYILAGLQTRLKQKYGHRENKYVYSNQGPHAKSIFKFPVCFPRFFFEGGGG